MLFLPLLAATGAAVTQAAASFIAHGAVKQLGAIEFTRVQLTTSSLALAVMVTATHGWSAIPHVHILAIVISSLVGVLLTNLAMTECLRRGGPRRTQLFLTMRTPITALLALFYLGEVLTPALLVGASFMFGGILLAIVFSRGSLLDHPLEAVNGLLSVVVLLGLTAATCQAIGFVAIKPVMLEGMPPLAASAMRTMGSAWALTTITLIPTRCFAPPMIPTKQNVFLAIIPGLLGYVLASTLLLYAIQNGSAAIATGIASTVPVLSLPMLWLMTKQRPSNMAWVGAVLVVIGAVIIV